ncbi:MAG: PIN domain-containing protein [Deltaproteobacteria bacterium]|nr:PIN domain-containing protein [Candidatus Tharpella aukensis]
MAIIDANIVLRYILNDHEELSQKATDILEHQSTILPIEAACEVVYVLQKVYHVDRTKIKQCLEELVNEQLIIIEKPKILLKALQCFASTTFDFVDTLLWAYHAVEKQEILTFDVKLNKYIQRTTIEEE